MSLPGLRTSKYDFVTHGNDIVSCGNELITHGNELVSCGNNFLTNDN